VPEGERAVVDGETPVARTASFIKPPKTIFKDMQSDQTLTDQQLLGNVFGGLQAISTPGHSPGHMAYWQPEKRILFCGDVIFNAPRKTRLPYKILTVDMAENIRSIGKLAALEPEVICFGHGEPVTQNAAKFLYEFAKKVGAI
jgi:glyoxylase-like metal-dependent hydrolase (beta-lactamase superfamily II)